MDIAELLSWARDALVDSPSSDIDAAVVSIIGSIQPGRLAEYVSGAVRGGSGDDGLIQRFQLAVWPDCPASWRNVDRWPDSQAKRSAFDVATRLDELDAQEVCAELDDDGIPYLRFEPEAQGAEPLRDQASPEGGRRGPAGDQRDASAHPHREDTRSALPVAQARRHRGRDTLRPHRDQVLNHRRDEAAPPLGAACSDRHRTERVHSAQAG